MALAERLHADATASAAGYDRDTSDRKDTMSAFIMTRIQVGDYEAWRPMFEQDRPRAREQVRTQRVFRGVEDPHHVFIMLEFDSIEDADESRRRLIASGVLDRFDDSHGPTVVVEADSVTASSGAAGTVA